MRYVAREPLTSGWAVISAPSYMISKIFKIFISKISDTFSSTLKTLRIYIISFWFEQFVLQCAQQVHLMSWTLLCNGSPSTLQSLHKLIVSCISLDWCIWILNVLHIVYITNPLPYILSAAWSLCVGVCPFLLYHVSTLTVVHRRH